MEFLTWLLFWLFPNCKFDGTSFRIDDYLTNGGNDGIGPGALQKFSWINLTHPNILLDSYGCGNYNILDSEYDFYSLKDGVYPKTLSANVLSDIYKGTTGLKREEDFLNILGDLYYNKQVPLSVSGYYFLKDWYISNKIPFMPDNPIYDPLVDFLTNFADTFNL